MNPLVAEKIRVLGLVSLSLLLAIGFICILVSASRNGNWSTMLIALISISIPLPGKIGHMLMVILNNGDSQSSISEQKNNNTELDDIMLPGLGALCLTFKPIVGLSERNHNIWMCSQVLSIFLIVLALTLPLFWVTFSKSIGIEAAFLSTLGSFLMMLSIVLYSHIYHKDEDDILSTLEYDDDDDSSDSVNTGISGL